MFQASPGKNVCKTPSQWKNLGVLAYSYHPSYSRKQIVAQEKKARPYLNNNQYRAMRAERCGSSSRMPA
jgi:hypothetical protein